VTSVAIVFQIIAVVVIGFVAFLMIRGGGARHQAIRRILMLAFVVAVASSVFFPSVWTSVANLLGIGRGADLLLYFLVLTFLGFVASTYRRFRRLEGDLTELVRQVALLKVEHPPSQEEATGPQPDP
jgi:hypothetical protein